MSKTHAHHAPDPRSTGPSVSVMSNPRGTTEYVFVTDGIHGGEQVVPFDTVEDVGGTGEQLVLARRTRSGHTVEVFKSEHWGQYGEVSEWLESHVEVMQA